MALQFLVGGGISVINIMIHALITLTTIGVARRAGRQSTSRPRLKPERKFLPAPPSLPLRRLG